MLLAQSDNFLDTRAISKTHFSLIMPLKKGNFMCKTYDAIYEVKKMTGKETVVLWVEGAKIKGKLGKCECGCEGKCLQDIITLQHAQTHCKHTGEEVTVDWLNISSKYIIAFMFE